MPAWRDFLAQVSMVLSRMSPLMLAIYAGLIGFLFISLLITQGAAVARANGEFRGIVFIAAELLLFTVLAWKALRRRN